MSQEPTYKIPVGTRKLYDGVAERISRDGIVSNAPINIVQAFVDAMRHIRTVEHERNEAQDACANWEKIEDENRELKAKLVSR